MGDGGEGETEGREGGKDAGREDGNTDVIVTLSYPKYTRQAHPCIHPNVSSALPELAPPSPSSLPSKSS